MDNAKSSWNAFSFALSLFLSIALVFSLPMRILFPLSIAIALGALLVGVMHARVATKISYASVVSGAVLFGMYCSFVQVVVRPEAWGLVMSISVLAGRVALGEFSYFKERLSVWGIFLIAAFVALFSAVLFEYAFRTVVALPVLCAAILMITPSVYERIRARSLTIPDMLLFVMSATLFLVAGGLISIRALALTCILLLFFSFRTYVSFLLVGSGGAFVLPARHALAVSALSGCVVAIAYAYHLQDLSGVLSYIFSPTYFYGWVLFYSVAMLPLSSVKSPWSHS